jgi:hypothetical protein
VFFMFFLIVAFFCSFGVCAKTSFCVEFIFAKAGSWVVHGTFLSYVRTSFSYLLIFFSWCVNVFAQNPYLFS